MAKTNSLSEVVYSILCDLTVFEIGYVDTQENISNKVLPIIKNSGLFNTKSNKQIKHSVRNVLEHRNNCYRNKRRREIIRDIATVKKDLDGNEGHNIYLFGCLVYNYTTPLKKS